MKCSYGTPLVSCCLNESPSEKEGKYDDQDLDDDIFKSLNESPSEKEGKCHQKSTASAPPSPQ